MSQVDAAGDLGLLTGPLAAALLEEALAERVLRWAVRRVDHQPGGTTTASYRVRIHDAGGERTETLGAAVGPGRPMTVWRLADDPALPGLATATDVAGLGRLLQEVGVTAPPQVTLRSYRPRRRAVVEVTCGGRRLFVKVLRPGRAGGLALRHALLHDAGMPVPPVLATTPAGLVVTDALPGVGLRRVLRGDSPGAPPTGAELVHLLAALPDGVRALPRRRSWTDGAVHYARAIGTVLPAEADRAAHLAVAVGTAVGGCGPGDAPTHGDLHDHQLLVEGGRISALLDLDTVGPGRLADDLACPIAHLALTAMERPARTMALEPVVSDWLSACDDHVDPVELRHRVAGVLLSLALGPMRVQQVGWPDAVRARLDLTERWVEPGRTLRRRHNRRSIASTGRQTR